jgi:hypothetical protein
MKGSHLSVSIELSGKFCTEFILDVGIYSYKEFAPRKLYHSGALDSSSIINLKRRKMKGSYWSVSIELCLNFFAQNSFWMLAIIPTKSLLPENYIILGH